MIVGRLRWAGTDPNGVTTGLMGREGERKLGRLRP